MNTKYIYFFRSDLSSHVDIYKSWLDVVQNSIDMSMVTILDYKEQKKQKELVIHYRKKGLKIFIVPRYTKQLFALLYFFYLCTVNDKVVVHLRKQSPKPFDILKKLFTNKLKYIIEIEGDFESEIDYLSQKKNQYKPRFYTNIINGMKKSAKVLEEQIVKTDGVFVVTKELKELFIKRYNNAEEKIRVIPTGFDTNKFYPNDKLRIEYRKRYNLENKFVMIYSGNVMYSWQNLKQSIRVFKLLKEETYKNLFFVMLVRKQDYEIAREFIDSLKLEKDEYLLTSVSHDEVNGFLNASDLGILLRENHTLNKVASPGKLGEYLSSGLNVLTTKHIGNYSKKMEEEKVGILIDDIYDETEILIAVNRFEDNRTKKQISKWAADNFSVQAYKKDYINALESV
jgi:glycosyltransferase involved in cell wall biosynthesis